MSREAAIQSVLNYIDEHVGDELTLAKLAEAAGYSAYHFSRVFKQAIGIPVMSYVTWRKLQYALYDLSRGKKVVDVAMEYGYETHSGFTKAFVHEFGFPPSLCSARLSVDPPERADVHRLHHTFIGGITMQPHIFEITPFTVAGYPKRHVKSGVKSTADAPTFWNTIHLDYGPILEKLYDAFPLSKHCEISMCYDADENTGEFTYMLGRGIDHPGDLAGIEPDMTRVDIKGGLYAVFPTPPAEGDYIQAAQEIWNEILTNWLPRSEFEYDETRYDFEYHDHRDHGWYFGGKLQIDIYLPIRQREEAKRKAQLGREYIG